ncbi:MAG: HAD family hydrolase [Clostridiales bacterium GWB2_37_7]|nr:MAG: HAD family hydrolase [Clostridiales bacterium GWB2_37_7]
MRNNLIPKLHVNSPYELDLEVLKKNSIKGVIIDIDNTLVPWSEKYADQRVVDLVDKLLDAGFKLCILSNGTKNRVSEFNKDLKLPAVHNAAKPSRAAFKKALKLLGTEPRCTAVIGDQIFTDILGGNRLGLFTVLVVPMSSKEFIWTRFVRQIEKLILKKYKHLINKLD